MNEEDDRPRVSYNGYAIVFREDEDEWYCHALRLSAPKLSTLKAKIDKLDATARRVSVPALRLDHYGTASPVAVVMVAKPKDWDRPNFEEQREGRRDRVPTVWTMVSNGNSKERSKHRLDQCFFPTESNLATLAEADKMAAEIKRLETARKVTLAMIPRLTLDDLSAKGAKEEDLDE